MKRKYIKNFNGPNEYREGEKNKLVYVFGDNGVDSNDIERVVLLIAEVIKTFSLPLQVLNGQTKRSEELPVVRQLITYNTHGKLIDGDAIENELEHYWNENVLRYDLIILVDPKKYEFKTPTYYKNPAIYGWGSPEGFVILRRFDLKNAVRHEFGHMIGLGHHHQRCVMDWSCPMEAFCDYCYKEIAEIWA